MSCCDLWSLLPPGHLPAKSLRLSQGVDLGGVDFVKYAEAFGAKGLRATSSAEIEAVMKEALAYEGVCVVDVVIDYTDNHDLMSHVIPDSIS